MTQQVITRFHLRQYTRLEGHLPNIGPLKMTEVQLTAVKGPYDHSDPQASIEMLIANEEAAQLFRDAFENGQDIAVTFSLFPKESAMPPLTEEAPPQASDASPQESAS